MSEVTPEIIAKTQKSLGKYVKKPTLSEKLLKKPPFRFLHDVIKVVIKETGFLNGLFSDDELNSDNVKEKEAKVAFLTKLIDAVKTVSKTDLKVRPSKIVAGLEPAETNVLLQTIAKSIDRKIDTKEYVAKVNSGEILRVVKEKNIKSSKHDKDNKGKISNTKEGDRKDCKTTRDGSVNRVKKTANIDTPQSTDRKRESSRSKTKETQREQKKEKSSGVKKKNDKESKHRGDGDKFEKKNDRNTKDAEKNNKDAESMPSLNTFNINNNVVENEYNTSTIDESVITTAADSTPNNGNEPTPMHHDMKEIESEKNSVNKPDENNMLNFSNARLNSASLVRPKSARPKSGDRFSSSRSRSHIQDTQAKNSGETEELIAPPIEIKPSAAATARPPSSLRPPSVRPSSARPGAPRLRPDSVLPPSEPVIMGNINVIVENFDSGLGDDEDTVVVQNVSEVTADDGLQASELLNISGENKGQLVEQILEKIQEDQEDGGVRKKVEIDWEQDGLRGKDATTKEVTQLRTLIQSLTRTANPLGKLMNYLHEDLDAMHNELQMWTNMKKQLYTDIENQKKVAVESSKPLLDKLNKLRQEAKKQEQEILAIRSNILRNDQRISELLGNK